MDYSPTPRHLHFRPASVLALQRSLKRGHLTTQGDRPASGTLDRRLSSYSAAGRLRPIDFAPDRLLVVGLAAHSCGLRSEHAAEVNDGRIGRLACLQDNGG